MTLEEFVSKLNTMYPTRHYEFTSAQKPPFIIYLDEGEEDLRGDDQVIETATFLRIELYMAKRDIEAEKQLKKFFNAHEIPYEKGATIKVDSEGLFLCPFTIQLI